MGVRHDANHRPRGKHEADDLEQPSSGIGVREGVDQHPGLAPLALAPDGRKRSGRRGRQG